MLPFDPNKRRAASKPAQSEVVYTSSLRREDLPWIGVFDIGPYQIPLFVGLPGDDPPSAA